MNILYVHGITRVSVHKKIEDWQRNFKLVSNFKRRVGYKFLIFPIYENLGESVLRGWWSEEFYSTAKDFKHSKIFLENGKFYHKPHCSIYMNDKSNKDVYFNTVEELEKYIYELKAFAPNIIIE